MSLQVSIPQDDEEFKKRLRGTLNQPDEWYEERVERGKVSEETCQANKKSCADFSKGLRQRRLLATMIQPLEKKRRREERKRRWLFKYAANIQHIR